MSRVFSVPLFQRMSGWLVGVSLSGDVFTAMPLYSIPIFSFARTHSFPRYFPLFLKYYFGVFFFHRPPRCAIFSLVITSRRWKQCSVSSPWRSVLVIKPFYPCPLLLPHRPPFSSPFSRFSSLRTISTRVSCNFVICTPCSSCSICISHRSFYLFSFFKIFFDPLQRFSLCLYTIVLLWSCILYCSWVIFRRNYRTLIVFMLFVGESRRIDLHYNWTQMNFSSQ